MLVLVPQKVADKLAGKKSEGPSLGEVVDAAKPVVDGFFNLVDMFGGKGKR